jgi:hypothetical protein
MPRLPDETAHLWGWFLDLNGTRSAGFTINPIGWSDIHAYFQLQRIRPDGWEIATLRALDDAYLSIQNDDTSGTVAGAKALKGQMTGNAAA